MTQYMILIYGDESRFQEMTEDQVQGLFAAHGRFAGQIGELGATMLAGDALGPSSTATTVRDDIVTDGPFAETKEVLGGYYLVDARDLDHALQVAKLCPAPYGCVEVRPVMDTGGM
jgi:hypothetical protein